ncbi:L,D-transpeptidase [Parahaliea maris]|uniref:L,D-transpeptidase n=1 Tax=Parahaliea maris TaxID=2716870 RepID=A0A5C9A5Q6_9GAMM|nr:L,D-transpeptidase [Parahaliea maris]TXS95332.1 L,D-transpeptidase [Parahaliea maris]
MFRLTCCALLLWCCATLVPLARAQDSTGEEVWIAVDTAALRLSVMRGKHTLRRFDNIAIGSNGVTRDKRRGDEKTPLGEFHLTEIRTSERFDWFLGFDYPTLAIAERAWRKGGIGDGAYAAIRTAWRSGEPPPQDTVLGGHLGIHGLGRGNLEVHLTVNWTNGCIALTNEQVLELVELVYPGTRVTVY